MNDLSALTHAPLRLRMRSDLFQEHDGIGAATLSIGMIEKCDQCGSVRPLYDIQFTGTKFLCHKCAE